MKFIFDECVSEKIAQALMIMGKDTSSCKTVWGAGTPDEKWIPSAAQNGWCVLTSDKLRQHRRTAYAQEGCRIFLITSKNLNVWEEFRLIVNRWTEIEKVAEGRNPPYIMRVSKSAKLQELPF